MDVPSRTAPPPMRRHLVFAGRVQGVGFRFETWTLASGFAVRGFVRNLPDGRVELVAEGAVSALDAFERALTARMHHNITRVERTEGPATGEFNDFSIRA